MSRIGRFAVAVVVAVVAILLWLPREAHAQLNTQHIKGSAGLKSGTQPPPNPYIVAPVLYFYNADEVRLRDGAALPISATLNTALFGVGYSQVTSKKLLGANYGFQALFPIGANNRIQGTEIDQNPGAGLSDTVVQPISLGWHGTRFDAIAVYTLYLPTGRFTPGATNNTGLGMWGQEPGFGTTVYLTANRMLHAATLATFTFQSKKEDTDTKVGTAMNLEGGVGADFLKGGLTVGLAYYWSQKLTQDQIQVGSVPVNIEPAKAKVFALGPDVSLAIAKGNRVYGFTRVCYQWETYARSQTQGGAWNILVTILGRPMEVPGK